VEAAGGRVELVPVVKEYSNTALIAKARAASRSKPPQNTPVTSH
jgi:hypothetical protein